MIQSYEAVIDQHGELKFINPVELPRGRRVIITVLEDEVNGEVSHEELASIPVVTENTTDTDAEDFTQPKLSGKEFLLSVAGTVDSDIEDSSHSKPSGIIAKLLENPVQISNFKPLRRDEVYDRKNV